MIASLKSALEQHEVARVQARVRRHRDGVATAPSAVAPGPVDSVMAIADAGSTLGRDIGAELGLGLLEDMESSSSADGEVHDASVGGEDRKEVTTEAVKPLSGVSGQGMSMSP